MSLPPDVVLIRDLPRVIVRAVELASDYTLDVQETIESMRRLVDLTSSRCWDSAFFPADFIALGLQEEAAKLQALFEQALREVPPVPCDDEPPSEADPGRERVRWPWARRK